MMALTSPRRIQRLSEATKNKIAAGEVVERPASVVKELLENALDSGADQIVLEIKGAGLELIKVTDNGGGINPADADLVFERYATSKIAEADDLYRVVSFGFRGEALSSIAAVGAVEILSCAEEGKPALRIEKRPEAPLTTGQGARSRGTTVSVRNLFSGFPVRRKFLSSDAAELGRITSLFSAMAVGSPGIAFRLIAEGKEKVNLTATDNPVIRIGDVYGRTLADNLITGQWSDDRLEARVFFGNLDTTRANRSGQLFFVNRRLIENRNLERGLRIGFRDLLPPGRFPVAFTFLSINTEEIDVNVHPTKKEIRIAGEDEVVRAIGRCITSGFQSRSVIRGFSQANPPTPAGPSAPEPYSAPSLQEELSLPSFSQPLAEIRKPWPPSQDLPASAEPVPSSPAVSEQPLKTEMRQLLVPYFQLHNTYILCQIKKGLLIIDQHVAHERILYERVLKSVHDNEPPVVQQLLFPAVLDLSITQKLKFDAYLHYFAKTGFSVRSLSGQSVMVDGVPAALKEQPVAAMVTEILDAIAQDNPTEAELDVHFAKSYACGAAIKAGQTLSLEEINNLVDLLFQCENPYTCPHGRPIVVRLPLEEIDRRFMR